MDIYRGANCKFFDSESDVDFIEHMKEEQCKSDSGWHSSYH